jgi:hypothetical protein
MATQGTSTKDITDKVNNMTVDDPTPTTDSHTVESVLSGDTITIMKQPPLEQRSRKRQRTEETPRAGTSNDIRDRYPIESKKPYLNCKTLHKKKLALAFTISRVEGDLNSGKAPPETTIRQRIPGRIAHHTELRAQWHNVLSDASKRLGHLYLDKLTEDYTQIRSKINHNFDQLKDTLDDQQFDEVKESLTSKYKQAAAKPPSAPRRAPIAPTRNERTRNPQRQPSQMGQRQYRPVRPRDTNAQYRNNDVVGQIMALINKRFK